MSLSSAPDSPIRWGILATGKIAATFAADLALVDGAELAAVGSRTLESAREFALAHGAGARPYGSYAELAADPELDIIYVASPHGRHFEDVMTCFEAGKAVLCEKSLTLDAADTSTLIEEARHRGLFFAEAMWMRCNPNIRKIQEMVAAGACGTVGQVRAELGFLAKPDIARLWDPELGASSLLDVGIYPLTLTNLILGEPTHIVAAGIKSERGIDISGGATLTYTSGAIASIAWTQVAWSDNRAAVSGDGGRIELPRRFHEATGFSYAHGTALDEFAEPVLGRGYVHEILEVNECLRSGMTESALLPLDGTLEIMKQIDEIRRQIG
jgi:predicted dehydrogenase